MFIMMYLLLRSEKVTVVIGRQLINQNYFTIDQPSYIAVVIASCILHNRDSESFPTPRVGFVISGEVAVFVVTMNL